jgi:hypothetical protein
MPAKGGVIGLLAHCLSLELVLQITPRKIVIASSRLW